MNPVFTLRSEALPPGTAVVGFRGSEALSRPYRFTVWFTIPSELTEFDMVDFVGARATLEVGRLSPLAEPHVVHGILVTVELELEAHGRALFRAELAPAVWRLAQVRHSRVFTNLTVPAILTEVLVSAGFTPADFALRLEGSYPVEEHVCQYCESDLDFLARWMEREGIYSYFEQGEERERLVFVDHRASHEASRQVPVRYHPIAAHDGSATECFDVVKLRRVSLPGGVRVADYDYLKPSLELAALAPIVPGSAGEVVEHAGRVFRPDDVARVVKLRAEEVRAREAILHAAGTVLHVRPGYRVALEDHPRAALNGDYLVTALEHVGNQGATTPELQKLTGLEGEPLYRVELAGIPGDVQFRSERRTPWPRIYGHENGVVDGEAESDYAQLDEHGRYHIKLRFDERARADGAASTWIRMAQPHGGTVEGFHFPLRKGTEVLVSFLGGDPDRPVIAAVLPNAHTPSPVTRSNHTTNVLQTGGRNRFELEDKKGEEHIALETPHTSTMIRLGHPYEGHNLFFQTEGASMHKIGLDWNVEVGGNKKEFVLGNSVKVKKGSSKSVKTGHSVDVYLGSKESYFFGTKLDVFAGASMSLKAAAQAEFWATLKLDVGRGVKIESVSQVSIKLSALSIHG
ncbi:MAG: type VI secretion system tip protein VgrG [Deltaproteobacteria bacterium]|nr:type VI secretion system tip protein VgrG [Deltaproteobacteria bacterium]